MGINVQPLLAVGGVSGIAIGFGAQSVSANAITGINLVGPQGSHAHACVLCMPQHPSCILYANRGLLRKPSLDSHGRACDLCMHQHPACIPLVA